MPGFSVLSGSVAPAPPEANASRIAATGIGKARLDRDLKNRFRSNQYTAEELIAESAGAYLYAEFGFNKEVEWLCSCGPCWPRTLHL